MARGTTPPTVRAAVTVLTVGVVSVEVVAMTGIRLIIVYCVLCVEVVFVVVRAARVGVGSPFAPLICFASDSDLIPSESPDGLAARA